MMDTQTKKRFPWLKFALAVSVTLNLAALGVLGGILTRTGGNNFTLHAAISALPEEDRRAVRRETREIWRNARMQREGSATPWAIIEALRAEEFNPDELSATLREAQDRSLRIGAQMNDRIVARVSAMSPERRRAYADSLEEQLEARRTRPRPSSARDN